MVRSPSSLSTLLKRPLRCPTSFPAKFFLNWVLETGMTCCPFSWRSLLALMISSGEATSVMSMMSSGDGSSRALVIFSAMEMDVAIIMILQGADFWRKARTAFLWSGNWKSALRMARTRFRSDLALFPAIILPFEITRPSSIRKSTSFSWATICARWLFPVPAGPTKAITRQPEDTGDLISRANKTSPRFTPKKRPSQPPRTGELPRTFFSAPQPSPESPARTLTSAPRAVSFLSISSYPRKIWPR